jgi:hypothetical protein
VGCEAGAEVFGDGAGAEGTPLLLAASLACIAASSSCCFLICSDCEATSARISSISDCKTALDGAEPIGVAGGVVAATGAPALFPELLLPELLLPELLLEVPPPDGSPLPAPPA